MAAHSVFGLGIKDHMSACGCCRKAIIVVCCIVTHAERQRVLACSLRPCTPLLPKYVSHLCKGLNNDSQGQVTNRHPLQHAQCCPDAVLVWRSQGKLQCSREVSGRSAAHEALQQCCAKGCASLRRQCSPCKVDKGPCRLWCLYGHHDEVEGLLMLSWVDAAKASCIQLQGEWLDAHKALPHCHAEGSTLLYG